jgi:hypothetical protein
MSWTAAPEKMDCGEPVMIIMMLSQFGNDLEKFYYA